ncbi:MAG: hypothetical protein HYZ66_06315 [Chlamydiae bacterium]|nr:hypothetical protein [Chlamydiota bacterium]
MSKSFGGVLKAIRVLFASLFFIGGIHPAYSQVDFQVSSPLQQKLNLESYQGFLLLQNLEETWNSNYAIICSFEGNAVESQTLLNAQNFDAAKSLIDQNLTVHPYKSVEIRELILPLRNGKKTSLFWIGHRAYANLEEAEKAIDTALSQGIRPQDIQGPTEIESSQTGQISSKEEYISSTSPQELTYQTPQETSISPSSSKEKGQESIQPPKKKNLYPFHLDEKIKEVSIPGTRVEPEQERFDFQNFGEFSWRRTNFDFPRPDDTNYFEDIVGFISTRVIMKGLQFYEAGPYLSPYVEGTFSISTRSDAFENKLVTVGGVEYRLLEGLEFLKQNHWFEWVQRFRFYGQYMDLYSLRKERETGPPSYDWRVGVDLYKDWGWDQPFDEQDRNHLCDYLWAELFWDSKWEKTDFNRDDYDSFTITEVTQVGLKFPWVGKIPPLMPYVRLEFTESQRDFFFQNRVVLFGGIRYMPFHTKQFKSYEWLYGLKLYAEAGQVESYFKDEPPDDRPDWDFRVGIKIDINRF